VGKKNSVFGLEPSRVLKMDSLKKKKRKKKKKKKFFIFRTYRPARNGLAKPEKKEKKRKKKVKFI
jgi:hypothetical protein